MKSLYSYFEKMGCECEAIFCSSDVNSLDGVIIKKGEKSVAVIDGTAPHQTDTVLPGAYDTLINLGEAWQENELVKRRERIKELNKSKSKAYSDAYDNLMLSSIFAKKIEAEIKNCYNIKESKCLCDNLFKKLYIPGSYQKDVRLVSAFSKDGHTHLDTLKNISDVTLYVNINSFGAKLFVQQLALKLMDSDTDLCLFPTPLQNDFYEAIYIKASKTAIIIENNATPDIDTDALLDKEKLNAKKAELASYDQTKNLYLEKAKLKFALASEYHFSLESIYTAAMDFDKLGKISDALKLKCKNLLFNTI
jgi:hypothetical protein